MGAKKFVTIEELCELKNLKLWRIYDLSRKGKLPIRFIDDNPVIPYEIDLDEFEKLESVSIVSRKRSSLKIEETSKSFGHKKETLWQK